MSYAARTHIVAGAEATLADYNQGMDNEAQLKAWVDIAGKASMTNKSGGDLAAGAVVILEAAYDDAFTTTTIASDRRILGVLSESIANNAAGLVYTAPEKCTVLVQGNVARGDFLVTSTTAGRASSVGKLKSGPGIFAVATTAYSGGGAGSVSAILLPGIELGLAGGNLYHGGGYQGAVVATTYKWTTSTDTTGSVAGAALSVARRHAGGVYASLVGYAIGGFAADESAVVDKLTFSSEVTASISAIPAARSGVACNLSANDIYALYGVDSAATDSQSRYKMNLVSQTWSTLSAGGSIACALRAGVNTTAYGYVAGYHNGASGQSTEIKRTQFTTDTEALVSSALSQAKSGVSQNVSNATDGWFLGGAAEGVAVYATAEKFTFATEGIATVGGAALSAARQNLGTGSDGVTAGYLLGGTTANSDFPVTNPVTTADKLVFGSETTSAVGGAALGTATLGGAGMFGG
jgi:hypothetical protein